MPNSASVSADPSALYYVGIQPEQSVLESSFSSDDILTAVADGYDVLALPVTNPSFRARVTSLASPPPSTAQPYPIIAPPTLSEVNLPPDSPYTPHVFALASKWIELDSNDERVANLSAQILKHELAYAAFCGIAYVVVPGPKRRNNVSRYAEALSSALQAAPFTNIVLHLAMAEYVEDDQASSVLNDQMSIWDIWNSIRTMCDYPSRLSVGLQVPPRLPTQAVLSRWFAEPVTILFISGKVFLHNSKGYPVLSKAHQYFMFKFLKLRPYTILQDIRESTQVRINRKPSSKDDESAYLIYVRHLHTTLPPPTAIEKFGASYEDYLQNPLQPLSDDLESKTYEVFEKDPVKYDQYEKAIYQALLKSKDSSPLTVAVLGAGRGPLVARALKAAKSAGVSINTFAVEKNPSAYVYLQKRKELEWGDSVEVVFGDIRSWRPAHGADILISELLGSFGDNELSPECLDGVKGVLKPSGIMIPQSYTAHLTPAMSPKLYATIKAQNKDEAAHTPYVVLLQAVDLLSSSIHQAWEFSHATTTKSKPATLYEVDTSLQATSISGGNRVGTSNEHNARYSKGRFLCENRGVMHGFAGYFESVLYNDVEISTRPDTINKKSKDMVSWFPIWFPLPEPLYVPDNSEIEISIWRKTDNRKVWYEWSVETFVSLPGATSDRHLSSSSATAYASSSRRIRLACSQLCNPNGKFSSMNL
ncbi:PRMT5 arginine-N-methyltransferase-domain-containing protein [Myxozyma melibiosi]|uniref:Protein arginine N-methyltransferase n=1 Tax=Myxozyma melibiosi TaxID=54550 RepID=A0ABR1FD92_9ASCO